MREFENFMKDYRKFFKSKEEDETVQKNLKISGSLRRIKADRTLTETSFGKSKSKATIEVKRKERRSLSHSRSQSKSSWIKPQSMSQSRYKTPQKKEVRQPETEMKGNSLINQLSIYSITLTFYHCIFSRNIVRKIFI